MNGARNGTFFWPCPLGPWGGAKRSNIIKFQLLSQFQIFLNPTLCVFSQMKDIKHIRQDFHSVSWVMPHGSDLRGYKGAWGLKKIFFLEFNQIRCVSNSHEWHMQRHKYFGPFPLGRGQKVLFCFVALRPKSTAMVIAGRSVHQTTLFPGQA